jgi:hypothetical protein
MPTMTTAPMGIIRIEITGKPRDYPARTLFPLMAPVFGVTGFQPGPPRCSERAVLLADPDPTNAG